MTARFSCCEVCERSPTCGNDCGSCDPEREALLEKYGLTEAVVDDYMAQFATPSGSEASK